MNKRCTRRNTEGVQCRFDSTHPGSHGYSARYNKRLVGFAATVLPGQSRSVACPKRACRRLDGHKGACRGTLNATVKAPVKAARSTEGGVEVLSADRYTVLPERKARKARRPKVVVLPMAEYTRLVAAASKVTHQARYHVSGKPSARLA